MTFQALVFGLLSFRILFYLPFTSLDLTCLKIVNVLCHAISSCQAFSAVWHHCQEHGVDVGGEEGSGERVVFPCISDFRNSPDDMPARREIVRLAAERDARRHRRLERQSFRRHLHRDRPSRRGERSTGRSQPT